ncbi:MAG: HEAT repeat domain-containing protein [Candidatus Micrarchaeia archaeon]
MIIYECGQLFAEFALADAAESKNPARGFYLLPLKVVELILMPEKPKAKTPRQVSLLDAAEDKPDDLDRMVAQAFDSDPAVRLKVANGLSKIDDPRAIFALIELSSDKDEAVKETAQRGLGQRKDEQEEIVSIGKLLSERKSQPAQMPSQPGAQQAQQTARADMMPAIERLFAHYEPKRRESAKRKLLPSLQKLFGFRPEELDPLRELDKISAGQQMRELDRAGAAQRQPAREEKRDADESEAAPQNAANFPFGKHEEPRELPHRAEHEVEVSDEDVELVSEEKERHEASYEEDIPEPAQETAEPGAMSKYYALAYRIATTPGMGKPDLKRESNRLINDFKREVELAFKLASEKARDEGLATFANLKPGMKSLSFNDMPISAISEIAYGPRRKPYARIVLFDGKKEIALLVPKERASGIAATDRLAAKKVAVDFLMDKGEVVLLATGKSSIVVYK